MIIIGVVGDKNVSTLTQTLKKIATKFNFKIYILDDYTKYSIDSDNNILKLKIKELEQQNTDIVVIKIIPKFICQGVYNSIQFNIIICNIFKKIKKTINKNYIKKLFNNMNDNGIVIVNGDDKQCVKLLDGIKKYVITYGLSSRSTITASSIDLQLDENTFIYCLQRIIPTITGNKIEPQEFPVKVSSDVEGDTYGILAAVTSALVFNIDIDDEKGLILQ